MVKSAYAQVSTGDQHLDLRPDAHKWTDRRRIFCEKIASAWGAQPPEASKSVSSSERTIRWPSGSPVASRVRPSSRCSVASPP